MKKILFTCFLAFLCLFGSASTLDQVVQSPGADFPHRSVSNRGGETRPDTLPGILYLELLSSIETDSIPLRFWEHLVSDRSTVNPGFQVSFPLSGGTMFEGSRNAKVSEIAFPEFGTFGYFSLGRGKNTLIKQWIFFPSDRVRLRADLLSGALVFGGPDADFYRLQYEVDLAFKEAQFNSDPILFSSDSAFMHGDPKSAALWEQSRSRPQDLYVRMKVISDQNSAWEEFDRFAMSSWLEHPAMIVLERYVGKLPYDRLDLIESSIKGRILFQGIHKAELAGEIILQNRDKMARVRAWVDDFQLKESGYSNPLLVQGTYQWALMEAMALQKPITQVFETFPNPLREEMIAFYILDNFNRMEDRLPEIIAQNIRLVDSNWITDRLNYLLETGRRDFEPLGMKTADGKDLDPEAIKGKTLLIHFWISGCKFCIYDHRTVMTELSVRYRDHPEVMILTVNADAEAQTWRKGLESGEYTSPEDLNTWVQKGSGILKTYGIHSFPQKMIVGSDGKVHLQSIDRMDAEELSRRLNAISKGPILPTTPNP